MNMITSHHNYDNGYIGLVNLQLANLSKTVDIEDYHLLRKSELHISLLAPKHLAPLIVRTNGESIEQIQDKIVAFFKEFVQTTPLTTYRLTDEVRLVKRDERVTLVAMAKVPGIGEFFAALNARFNTNLPIQVTHITIYTLQPDAGIGINSPEMFEQDSHIVNIPFAAAILQTS
jgi:hypothetical protein